MLGVLDVLGDADLDAVEGVDHVLEALEVDDDVVVDPDAGDLLELPDRAGRAADGVRLVPDHVLGAGDLAAVLVEAGRPVDEGVARDADAVGALPVGGQVQHDRGVGPLAVAGEAVDVAALAVAAVGAHHQDVERLLRPLDLLLRRPVVAELRGQVLVVEVVVPVVVGEHDRGRRTDAEDEQGRGDHLGDGVPFPQPSLAGDGAVGHGCRVRGAPRLPAAGGVVRRGAVGVGAVGQGLTWLWYGKFIPL